MVPVNFWGNTRSKTKQNITQPGHGLSRGLQGDEIPPNAAFDMQNLDSRKPYAMKSREPRTALAPTFTSLTHLGSHKDSVIEYVDGTTWGYLNGLTPTAIATVTAGNAEVADFREDTLFVNGVERKFWEGPGGATGNIPDMPVSDFIAVHQNRVYVAAKATEVLSFSALGIYTDFSTSDDAGSIEITTRDTQGCSGLVQYANHIMYFKRNSIHELYGTGPFNYQMQALSDEIGCIAGRTIVEVMGKLLFLADDGVYEYVGGLIPKKISFDIQDFIDDRDESNLSKASASTDGERYYLCLPVGSNDRIVFTYDLRTGEWFKEDDTDFKQLEKISDTLYGITATKITQMIDPDGLEVVEWFHESKEFDLGEIVSGKNLHNLGLHLDCTEDVEVYVKDETTGYQLIKTIPGPQVNGYFIIAVPMSIAHNAKFYQIKIQGTGPAQVFELEHQLRIIPRTY